jgi:phage/plasmid-like protein (TIGR03299 family)
MGHELDITDGVASFADSRVSANGQVDAWHKLGTPVGHLMTVDEALDAAHMRGWDVRKQPLTAQVPGPDGNPVNVVVPDCHVVVRTNPVNAKIEGMGVVGNRWTPFQNEETTELLNQLVDEGGAHIETIGALRGGRDTFVTMKLPGHMEFRSPVTGELDVTDLYVIILNSHTGKAPLRALLAPVRVVCANTQRMAEHSARSTISLRHTGTPTARLAEVRNLLGLTFAYQDTFAAQCEALIAREVSPITVMEVLSGVFGVPAATTERQAEARKVRAGEVVDLYRTSAAVAPFHGTAFGVYNAVTEYLDHYAPLAGGKELEAEEAAVRRAQRTLVSTDVADLKAAAFSSLLAV